jgi:predicted lipase
MKLTKSFSFENALHFAKLSELAYEKSEETFKKETKPMGYKNIKYFDVYGAQCYGLEADEHVVLTFRGTEANTKNDVFADLNILLRPDYDGLQKGRVHSGFRDEVDTLWIPITEWLETKGTKQIYTCGHSLGGAMSGIAASRLPGAICYNYGCPRIGTNKWKKAFEKGHKMFRFVNDRDIVPRIPPTWMRYRHTGDLFFIDKKGKIIKNPNKFKQFRIGLASMCMNPLRITEGISDHSMTDYVKFIRDWVQRK